MAKRRRREQNSGFRDAVSLITSLALIVIAVLMVIFVYIYIKNNTGGISSLLPGQQAETTAAESSAQSSTEEAESGSEPFDIAVESDSYGLYEDPQEGIIFILSPEQSPLYTETNKKRLSDGRMILTDEWMEWNGRLYHFDKDGHIRTGRYSEGAMNYVFDDRGMLQEIRFNPAYRQETYANAAEYPGLVQTRTLWAFLNEQKKVADLYAIMYKKTTDSLSHQLGGSSSPQYTSPNAMAIAGGYIYYLAVQQEPTALTEQINKKLYRMKPGDTVREMCAEAVEGYKVLEGADGSISVFVYNGETVFKVQSFTEDAASTVISFTTDGHYYVDTSSENRAVLMLEGGYPVTMETESFAVNNFDYSLAADGTIRSVKSKKNVSWNGYTYSVETTDAFGQNRSRVIRINNQTGAVEVISSEFPGSTGNLHYDFSGGRMYAEYRDEHGFAGILKITLDGDVDYLEDSALYDGTIEMIGLQNQLVIVHGVSAAEDRYVGLRMTASVPLAVAIDPMVVEEDDPDPSSVIESNPAGPGGAAGPGAETAAGPGMQTGSQTGPGGPGEVQTTAPEEYDIAVSGQPAETEQAVELVETAADNNDNTELSAGPGANAPGQDAPMIYTFPQGSDMGPGGQAPGDN